MEQQAVLGLNNILYICVCGAKFKLYNMITSLLVCRRLFVWLNSLIR